MHCTSHAIFTGFPQHIGQSGTAVLSGVVNSNASGLCPNISNSEALQESRQERILRYKEALGSFSLGSRLIGRSEEYASARSSRLRDACVVWLQLLRVWKTAWEFINIPLGPCWCTVYITRCLNAWFLALYQGRPDDLQCIPEREECFLMNPSQSNRRIIELYYYSYDNNYYYYSGDYDYYFTFITIITSYEYSDAHHVCCDQG